MHFSREYKRFYAKIDIHKMDFMYRVAVFIVSYICCTDEILLEIPISGVIFGIKKSYGTRSSIVVEYLRHGSQVLFAERSIIVVLRHKCDFIFAIRDSVTDLHA